VWRSSRGRKLSPRDTLSPILTRASWVSLLNSRDLRQDTGLWASSTFVSVVGPCCMAQRTCKNVTLCRCFRKCFRNSAPGLAIIRYLKNGVPFRMILNRQPYTMACHPLQVQDDDMGRPSANSFSRNMEQQFIQFSCRI